MRQLGVGGPWQAARRRALPLCYALSGRLQVRLDLHTARVAAAADQPGARGRSRPQLEVAVPATSQCADQEATVAGTLPATAAGRAQTQASDAMETRPLESS